MTSAEMWDRFMEQLAKDDPIGPREEPEIPHKSLFGSVSKYRKVFLKANGEQNACEGD